MAGINIPPGAPIVPLATPLVPLEAFNAGVVGVGFFWAPAPPAPPPVVQMNNPNVGPIEEQLDNICNRLFEIDQNIFRLCGTLPLLTDNTDGRVYCEEIWELVGDVVDSVTWVRQVIRGGDGIAGIPPQPGAP